MKSDPISPTLRVATETDESKREAAQAAVATAVMIAASPGLTVRAGRERALLSIEELAVQTRLARTTLEALERDDFASLNEPVYVRGYFRKCAKVLKLPETELIAAYDRMLGPKAPPMPTKLMLGNSGSTMGSMRRRGSGPSLLLVLAVAVAIGVGAWILMHDTALTPTLVTPTAVPATAAAPAIEPAPVSVPAATLEAQPTTELSATAVPSDAAMLTAVSTGSDPLSTAPAPAPTPVDAMPAAAAAPAAIDPAAPGVLVLNFRSSSWVRIEDADGRVLLSGTVQAGDHQVLKGRTPYALFIGYAPGVTVEFDGKPFDLAPHVRQNSTARISLPYVEQSASATPAAAPAAR